MLVYEMRLAQRSDGLDGVSCEWKGGHFEVASRNGATMVLARKLVAAGARDARWEARGGDGRLRICGSSLHRLAKLTVKEGDGRLKLVPFVDRPDFGPGNALGGVLEAGECRTPDKALQQPQHAPAAEMAA